MKKLLLLLICLIPGLAMGDDISWSSDCTSTNCGATIDGNDTVVGNGDIVTTANNADAINLNSSSSLFTTCAKQHKVGCGSILWSSALSFNCHA